MIRGKFQHAHFLLKAFLLVGCLLVCSVVAVVLATWLLSAFGTTDATLKVVQLLQTVFMMLVPALLCLYLCYDRPWSVSGLNGGATWQSAAAVAVFMLAALPFVNLLSEWNRQMELPAFLSGVEAWMKTSEEAAAEMTERFLSVKTLPGLLFNLFLMAMLPAFVEELLFRGVLLRLFAEMGRTQVAIWASAILFSAVHMQFYGFVPRMLLGALFGYLLVWSGSLWLPVLAHFVNNAFAVVSYYVVYKNGWDADKLDTFGSGDTLWAGLLSGALCCVGIYWLRRSLTMNKASSRK